MEVFEHQNDLDNHFFKEDNITNISKSMEERITEFFD